MRLNVIKRNKRLWIVDEESGEDIYTPPDFIRPHMINRRVLYILKDKIENGIPRIDAVMEFEGAMTDLHGFKVASANAGSPTVD